MLTDFVLDLVDPPPVDAFGLQTLVAPATGADVDGDDQGDGNSHHYAADQDVAGEGAGDVDVHVCRHDWDVL